MLTIRTILFPTDFSACAEQAFAQAVALATRYEAVLHVLHVVAQPEDTPDAEAGHADATSSPKAQAADLALAHVAAVSGRLDVVKAHAVDRTATDGILTYAEAHAVDVIVLGTHGGYGVGRFLLGSVAERVVRRASCAVWLVRCGEKVTRPPGEIQAILVPIDFSVHARDALRCAKDLAASYGARVDLLHVIEEPNYPAFYSEKATAMDTIQRDLESKAVRHLRRFYHEAEGPNGPVRFGTVLGHAAQEILAYAEEHAHDLLVTSTHGRAGVQAFFLGSVAEKVTRRAPCPVLVVRAFGRTLLE